MAKTIRVDYLARVEGEGALTIKLRGNRAESVELRIFEPPRFFEGFLRGRSQLEAPDITARICGICPVAYQMSACRAVEDAHGIVVSPPIRALRRLLYSGEWIESHALHMFMLHVPDFLGYEDAVRLAKDHPERVKSGLRIKKTGNAIVSVLGGREIHPVNVRVGGFYKIPAKRKLEGLISELEWTRDAMIDALQWMSGFDFPDFDRDYELVALRPESEYPFCEGRIASSAGLDVDVHDYDDWFEERQLEHSTALHSTIRGRGAYFCGPLARFNLNFDRLRPAARQAAEAVGFRPPCNNPFRSLLARAVEVIHAADEAIALIREHVPPDQPYLDVPVAAGVGYGCTEAPRGILYHRYHLASDGTIEDAKIVPPTSQNQKSIEEDLFAIAPKLAEMPHSEATWLAEQTVRNYDPCISCSTHFLELKLERGEK